MKPIKQTKDQSGQVIIVLLLVALVALTIGLAVTQKSITDITTSTQVEQSSRAFSAAEAGIERALKADLGPGLTSSVPISLDNESSAEVFASTSLPNSRQALEYPPIGKETIAHFWLAYPNESNQDPTDIVPKYLDPNAVPITNPDRKVQVYFGDYPASYTGPSDAQLPAIEVDLVTRDTAAISGNYAAKRFYFDSNSSRAASTGFSPCTESNNLTSPSGQSTIKINTSSSTNYSADPNQFQDRSFLCRAEVIIPVNTVPILIRARILYSSNSHKVAVKPVKIDSITAPDSVWSLPPQAKIYTSIGTAGKSQKTLQLFRMKYVVPPFIDFAIFSSADIRKQ